MPRPQSVYRASGSIPSATTVRLQPERTAAKEALQHVTHRENSRFDLAAEVHECCSPRMNDTLTDVHARARRRSSSMILPLSAPLVALTSLAYYRVVCDLVLDWWREPSLSYGVLIPPLAGWIAWSMRDQLRATEKFTDSRGLIAVAASCGMLLAGQLAAEFFVMRMSLVILLAGLVWTFWGVERLRGLSLPFLLLSTMVPLPAIVYNSLAVPLQLLATAVSARLAKLAGVMVYVDGNIIHLASISLGVEEACSGLNSLSTLIVAGVLLGFLQCSTVIARVLLVLLSIPAAILTNIIRVTATAVIADFNPDYALGFYHTFSGWAVFVLGFAMLGGASSTLHWMEERRR